MCNRKEISEEDADRLFFSKQISREQHIELLVRIATKRNESNISRKKFRASMSSSKWN